MKQWGSKEANRIFQEQDVGAVLGLLEDSKRINRFLSLNACISDEGWHPLSREEFDAFLDKLAFQKMEDDGFGKMYDVAEIDEWDLDESNSD